VPLLLLKLTLTPLLVGGATLAARRWGPAIGGWIVSLPLTSGPILFFLALDHGPEFAAEATTGTLLGLGAICGFSVGYLLASRRGPLRAFAAASAGFVLVAVAVQPITGAPFGLLAVLVVVAIAGVLRLLPASAGARVTRQHPAWDLPARVIVGTALVVGLTAIAPYLGPVTSGLVATFPVYVSVLAVFEHLHAGRLAALGVLRGVLVGLFGTVAFYVVVHALLVPAGIAVAFAAAIVVTLAIGAVALRRVRASVVEPEPEPV
jgi:hypothetical protein